MYQQGGHRAREGPPRSAICRLLSEDRSIVVRSETVSTTVVLVAIMVRSPLTGGPVMTYVRTVQSSAASVTRLTGTNHATDTELRYLKSYDCMTDHDQLIPDDNPPQYGSDLKHVL